MKLVLVLCILKLELYALPRLCLNKVSAYVVSFKCVM